MESFSPRFLCSPASKASPATLRLPGVAAEVRASDHTDLAPHTGESFLNFFFISFYQLVTASRALVAVQGGDHLDLTSDPGSQFSSFPYRANIDYIALL
jgi:hypothetical protein